MPSSPIAVRRISMPLSLVPMIVLRETQQALRVERHDRRGRDVR